MRYFFGRMIEWYFSILAFIISFALWGLALVGPVLFTILDNSKLWLLMYLTSPVILYGGGLIFIIAIDVIRS